MDKRRIKVTVRGLVQGVSFRAAARGQAKALGVTGWVRNQPDGSVLLEAQGPVVSVERMLAWCRVGPPVAEVSGVDVQDLPVLDGEGDFAIRH